MRRVIRIFANVAAAVSLLLCMAIVCLWVRSYWKSDGWGRSWYAAEKLEMRNCSIGSAPGRAQMSMNRLRFDAGAVAIVRNDGPDGNIYIVNFGAMSFHNRWGRENQSMDWPGMEHWWEVTGIYLRSKDNLRYGGTPGAESYFSAIVPYWVLFLVTAIGPGVWMLGWKRRRKRARWIREGRCGECGYDLRGSPGRCPECGAEPVRG